ncbi:MAG TPA: hypothetical protein VHA11_07360 [Bryobacteraceae bacterium]|nr:hypothetical protein [Bryobacteraceae bacterium]
MKALVLMALTAALVPAAQDTALPTIDQILDKYVQASGGREAIGKITSRVMKGDIEVSTYGVKGPFEQVTAVPGRTITTSEFEGYGKVMQGYDGSSGWASDPQQGLREMTAVERERARRDADLQNVLRLKSYYKSLTVKGKAKVGEHEAWLVEAQPAEGAVERLYFDSQSGLLSEVDIEMPSKSVMKVVLEDYKTVDGLLLPFTFKEDSPEISLVIRISEITHNVAIDPARFAKPAAN